MDSFEEPKNEKSDDTVNLKEHKQKIFYFCFFNRENKYTKKPRQPPSLPQYVVASATMTCTLTAKSGTHFPYSKNLIDAFGGEVFENLKILMCCILRIGFVMSP